MCSVFEYVRSQNWHFMGPMLGYLKSIEPVQWWVVEGRYGVGKSQDRFQPSDSTTLSQPWFLTFPIGKADGGPSFDSMCSHAWSPMKQENATARAERPIGLDARISVAKATQFAGLFRLLLVAAPLPSRALDPGILCDCSGSIVITPGS